MAKRSKSNRPSGRERVRSVAHQSPTEMRRSRRKLWCFRILAAVGIPSLLFLLLEVVLRLGGFGHQTSFLLSARQEGREMLVQNNRFGWRFFGPRLSRLPNPLFISRVRPTNTIRIVVLGESAAKGEPQPAFGLPRLLESVLALRHPESKFEVVNVAMTAINSHTIRCIAQDCLAADADIWVIYMGNNEVVGPFGAGTVFSQKTPPLPLIRAALAIQETRTGQAVASLVSRFAPGSDAQDSWGGMKMFLDQQVRADDARLPTVYHHFQRNLKDMLRLGHKHGVGMVVSTVAVNLRDCAPFASSHRNGLSESELAAWEKAYALGIKAQTAGDFGSAARSFQECARLDDTFAELRFRQAQCAMAVGDEPDARHQFSVARDLDTLRFRCDSEINRIIRQTVTNALDGRILLADAETAFAAASPGGVPGDQFFYEHVHLTFDGNHLLAQVLAEQIERLLPPEIQTRARPWPSKAECAARLAWNDWSMREALKAVQRRMAAPPFTAQAGHPLQLESLQKQIAGLSASLDTSGLTAVRAVYEKALAANPGDAELWAQLAELQVIAGDLHSAATAAQRSLELLPTAAPIWQRLGLIQIQLGQYNDAAASFQRAVQLDPTEPTVRQNLAESLWRLGRKDEALGALRQALKLRPDMPMLWINLGQLLEEAGRLTEGSECYQQAFERANPAERITLARFCRGRGWNDAAITNYTAAVNATPDETNLRLELGKYLVSLQRPAKATEQFKEAVRLDPDSAMARHLYGSMLGLAGKPEAAEAQLRMALELAPELLEARLNLGIALLSQGRTDEARLELEKVLQQSPTNALALKYVQQLQVQQTNR